MYKLVVPSSSDVELYSSHQLFHAATQLYSHYTQIIWPIILCEDVLSAIKFLYNLNYTIILLYSAPNVLYEALCVSFRSLAVGAAMSATLATRRNHELTSWKTSPKQSSGSFIQETV